MAHALSPETQRPTLTQMHPPAMVFVMPESLTPQHRAQLARSNKKLQQILGVAPSVVTVTSPKTPSFTRPHQPISRPRPASVGHAPNTLRRSRSIVIPDDAKGGRRDRTKKLTDVFGLSEIREEEPKEGEQKASTTLPLPSPNHLAPPSNNLLPPRTPASSLYPDTIHSRSSFYFFADDRTEKIVHVQRANHKRRRHQRPPAITVSGARPHSFFENYDVVDVHENQNESEQRLPEPDSPMSSIFHMPPGKLSRARKCSISSLSSDIADEILSDIMNRQHQQPSQDSKKDKMNRLAKHFGTQPPIELVFPPSPTKASRSNPKRYTLGLPPPLVPDSPNDPDTPQSAHYFDIAQGETEMINHPVIVPVSEEYGYPKGNVIKVDWDTINDEIAHAKMMNALRQLKA